MLVYVHSWYYSNFRESCYYLERKLICVHFTVFCVFIVFLTTSVLNIVTNGDHLCGFYKYTGTGCTCTHIMQYYVPTHLALKYHCGLDDHLNSVRSEKIMHNNV